MKRLSVQKGLTLVEFTAVSTFLLLVIFSFIEFAIYLYSIQTLNDMTRRAARLATVCYPYGTTNIPGIVTAGASLGITSDNINLQYLKGDGTETSVISEMRYVRAYTNYQFHFLSVFSFFGFDAAMPPVDTVLPVESLGIPRKGAVSDEDRTYCP